MNGVEYSKHRINAAELYEPHQLTYHDFDRNSIPQTRKYPQTHSSSVNFIRTVAKLPKMLSLHVRANVSCSSDFSVCLQTFHLNLDGVARNERWFSIQIRCYKAVNISYVLQLIKRPLIKLC